MGREELSGRDKWQDLAGDQGKEAEIEFYQAMICHLRSSGMRVEKNPKDLDQIYVSEDGRWGIQPDFAISGEGRTVYVEVKRQQAGGNAHERACKYWTPGILDSMRRKGGWSDPLVVPCWWIFTGGLTRAPRYRTAIEHWFRNHEGHVLLWQDISDHNTLTQHFDRHILPLFQRDQ